ncbi:MAG: acyltransferase [Chthoniobacteraceae bacterium]|nr:acyltransferase [Chthoniobacteraceae bacterium]
MGKMFYSLGAFKAGLALARLLPRSMAHTIAPVLGRIGYWHNHAGRKALRTNLARVTDRIGEEFDKLCASNVTHFSRMIADYLLCAGKHNLALELLEEWRGIENLERALALGKGVILVTAHLGNWELGATLLALRGLPMSIITLEEPTSELTRWRQEHRRQLGIKTITVGPGHDFAFVEMIQALRRNEILAMLVDRPYAGTGIPVTLFGNATDFSTGPALLWQHTGAAVVPAFVLRNPRGRYISFADPTIDLVANSDPRIALQENTQRVATYFESIIREHPEQWFNYVPIWNA